MARCALKYQIRNNRIIHKLTTPRKKFGRTEINEYSVWKNGTSLHMQTNN